MTTPREIKTHVASSALKQSKSGSERVTFDTAADSHVVNSNKNIKNEKHSSSVVVGVNPTALLRNLTEGDWTLNVKDENGDTITLPGRATVVTAADKNLTSHEQLIDDGIAEYAILGRSDHMSHILLTAEHGSARIPLRRVGNKWELSTTDQVLEVLESNLTTKPLTLHCDYNDEQLKYYHELLGHVNIKDVVRLSLIDQDMPVLYMPKGSVKRFSCGCCNQTKITGGPRKSKAHRCTSAPLQRVFIDIAGEVSTPAIGSYKFFMVIVNDATQHIFVYLLKNKFQAYGAPGTVKSDNAPELKEGEFLQFTLGESIYREFCAPYEKWGNGGAEHAIWTISEMVKAMLLTAKLPKRFWGLAAEYAPELKNEAPHFANENHLPPNRLWGEDYCGVKMLKPFGCRAWIWQPVDTCSDKRLDDAGIPGIFVGARLHGGARVYK
eukprot:1045168-Rhodomonas_salina.1